MLYICMASYFEAKAFIKKFALKKAGVINYADVYESENIVLIISGIGGMRGAVTVTRFLSSRVIKPEDNFANVGICGCSDSKVDIGTPFIVNKICSSYTLRCCYPDIIYPHDFEEASLMTYPKPQSIRGGEYKLYDMEAAEIFLAASEFFTLEKIFFLKVVSDIASPENVTRESIYSLMQNNKITTFLKKLSNAEKSFDTADISEKYTARFAHMLSLTETMKNELYRFIRYYFLSGGKSLLLDEFYTEKPKDKRTAKKYFEMLKDILLSI